MTNSNNLSKARTAFESWRNLSNRPGPNSAVTSRQVGPAGGGLR